ncbi:ABC transporter ATP-binding protein/permease [Fundidesulfovibrio agrisoli]|uniref:ABC transporter ATP-binding protein/permease n=1 Tax=Fundidesulfovibrio agrisoli TaxID=2922717 RepID=UPI001FAB40FA|nr:ABC transporter ATP-binding protein/permease [Fundidesulfovibrio agrisoli]
MFFDPKLPDKLYKRSLFSWVLTSNLKLQGLLLLVIVVTVSIRVLPLEMQKKIINEAIGGQKVQLLLLYCGYYLLAVVSGSALKFAINALQARIGQESLADMRKKLYAHILTLPINFFRTSSPGMIVSSLVTEVANAGDFVGQAIAVPVTNILTLLAFAGYLFYLNPLLAGLSMVLYPLALIFVPMMQRRSNDANRERVDTGRTMSTMIGETVSGIHEIHANASFRHENNRFGDITDKQYRIRLRWTLWKFAIKNSNNFFQSLGPFVLFLVGGWLAINGRFDLGALVAFLSANEKLYDPWKELMDFYQTWQDAKVSYNRVMEYFAEDCEFTLEPAEPREPLSLKGRVEVKDLVMEAQGGIKLLKGVSVSVEPGQHMALVGFSGSGKSTLALCIAQIYRYSNGHALLGGHEIADMAKSDLAENMGFVPQHPFIFDGSIRQNLLYGVNSRMVDKGQDPAEFEPSLDELIEITQQVGLFLDVLRFGLNTVFRKGKKEHLVQKIIAIREAYATQQSEELRGLVEFFDEGRYLLYASVAENLVFGNANDEAYLPENLPRNADFRDFLQDAGLMDVLLELGKALAMQTVDILKLVPGADASFFEQTPVLQEEFEGDLQLAEHLDRTPISELSAEERDRLLTLALRFTPGRHALVPLTVELERKLLSGRALFMDRIAASAPEKVSFYRRDNYIHTQTILDNILFGRLKSESPKVLERVNKSIIRLLIAQDMLERIVELGLDFQVGTMGDRLSGGQRQKVALARAFLKDPPLLMLDEATAALDNASQTRIQNLLENRWKGRSTVIAVVHRLDTIKNYDIIAVMKAGQIVESGSYQELIERKGMLYELVHGPRASA